jgi:hypothetical protein
MKEYTIEIKIDEDGLLEAETFGFKGKVCESEIKELLSSEFVIEEMDRKDEYYQSEEEIQNKKETVGRRIS